MARVAALAIAILVVATASPVFAQSGGTGWDGTTIPDLVNTNTMLATLVTKLADFYPKLILFGIGAALLALLWRFVTGGRKSGVAH